MPPWDRPLRKSIVQPLTKQRALLIFDITRAGRSGVSGGGCGGAVAKRVFVVIKLSVRQTRYYKVPMASPGTALLITTICNRD
jgi:hypothetical protein